MNYLNINYETRTATTSMRVSTDIDLNDCEDWELQSEVNEILRFNEEEEVITINNVWAEGFGEMFPNMVWEVDTANE